MAIALAEPGSPAWRRAHLNQVGGARLARTCGDAIPSATAASEPSDVSYLTVNSLGVLGLILDIAGRPDPPLAQRLLDLAHALGNPTALAMAYQLAGIILGRDQPVLRSEYQRRAAELAEATGAVLIHGFALAGLAAQQTDDPLRSARAQIDVLNHYLRLGNRRPPAGLQS